MRILFLGTPKFAKIVLENLINSDKNVIAVITQPDKKTGRKRRMESNITKKFAMENNILVMQPKNINESYEEIKKLNPDLILTAAYGQFISDEILSLPRYGSFNLHASLLPKYRGGAPIHWAIIKGEKYTGISLIHMDRVMDAGDIIAKEEIEISEFDTLDSLYSSLANLAGKLILKNLDLIENKKYINVKQDAKKVTFGYNILPKDEIINFNKKTTEVFNHIRGLDSIPGGHIKVNSIKYKLFNANKILDQEIINNNLTKKPGEIIDINATGLLVKTVDGIISIGTIQREGRQKLEIKDFINGNKNLKKGVIVNE